MKTLNKIKFSLAITLILMITITTGCSSSNDDSPHVNSPSSVTTIVNSGTWRVSYYFDTDHEETAAFTGYNFTFGSANVLTATNGTDNYPGTWSVTDSNSNDDSISDLHFNISFVSPAQFAKLNNDWEIIEKTATLVRLRDVSGGGGGPDFLTFAKN